MRRSLALVLAVVLSAACAGDILEPGWADEVPASRSGLIRVHNASEVELDEIYIRDCGAGDWGSNLLPNETVKAQSSRQFEVDAGCYDVQVVSTESDLADFRGIQVAVGRLQVVDVNF